MQRDVFYVFMVCTSAIGLRIILTLTSPIDVLLNFLKIHITELHTLMNELKFFANLTQLPFQLLISI